MTGVDLTLGVMTAEQRAELQQNLRGGKPAKEIPFAQPGSLTRVIAVASGKGGVGKSSVTVNLAQAMAAQGLKVGVRRRRHLRPLRARHARRRRRPADPGRGHDHAGADGVGRLASSRSACSSPGATRSSPGAGPMLDRALVQMLADVYWGDLDVLLLDLPPGTGDVAISLGQHLPAAEVIVVTTPQEAASEVAERAGTMASMMHQRVIGVIENMSYLACPHCGPEHKHRGLRLRRRRPGGRHAVARASATTCPCSAGSRSSRRCARAATSASRSSRPTPPHPAALELVAVAEALAGRGRGLAGMQLGLTPTSKF